MTRSGRGNCRPPDLLEGSPMSMDTLPAPTGARCSRGLKVGRAVAFAGALFVISASLFFAQPASALDLGSLVGSAVKVGESLAAPEAEVAGSEVVTGGGAACAASVVCGVLVGAGLLGVTLYQTRDSWMPVVSGLFKPKSRATSTNSQTASTGIASIYSLGGAVETLDVALMVKTSTTADYTAKVVLHNSKCYGPATGEVYDGPANKVFLGAVIPHTPSGVQSQGPMDVMMGGLCKSGDTIIHANASGFQDATGESFTYEAPTPEGALSQTTKVTCSQGSTVLGTVTASSKGYDDKMEAPSCRAQYPGSHPSHVTVSSGWPGSEQTAFDSALADPGTQFPDCFDASGAFLAACVVRVWVNGAPCHVGTPGCVDWQTDAQDNGDTVECRFGHYVVKIADCDQLSRAYQPNTGTRSLTTTDTQGKPADAVDPGVNTSTGTATGSNPTEGPNPETPTVPVDPETPGESQNCWGSGWSMNPVSWVYIPVKCALMWAFVPKTPFQGRIDDVKSNASGKFPFSLIAPLGAFAATIPAGACPDWNVKVNYPGAGDTTGGDSHTLDKNVVCDSSYTSALRTARPVFAAMMMVSALWPMIRGIAYGSFPIIKPVPTR